MKTPGSELDIDITGFATRLLELPETAGRAEATARAILSQFPATAITIYVLDDDDEGPFWSVRTTLGENAEPDPTVSAEAGILGSVFRESRIAIFEGNTLSAKTMPTSPLLVGILFKADEVITVVARAEHLHHRPPGQHLHDHRQEPRDGTGHQGRPAA